VAAPKFDQASIKTNGKLDDRKLARVKLPTREQRQFYASEQMEDGLSLRLVIGFGGTIKLSASTYNEHGKSVQTRLGTFPHISRPHVQCTFGKLKDARDKARELLKDPQRRVREKEAGTWGTVATAWYQAKIEGKHRTARETKRILETDLEAWHKRPFASIRRADVMKLLDPLPEPMCNHVLTVLRGVFEYWAPRMSDDYQIPLLDSMRRTGLQPRQRVLAYLDREQRIVADDLIAVWKAASDGSEFGRYIKFLAYTAQRRDCVISMEWSDLSADGTTWYPREQEGPGKAKGVPPTILLPQDARELVAEQRKLRGDSKRVWGCVAFSRAKARFDARCPLAERWTLNDLRRTSRSLMNTIKVKGADKKLRRAISSEVAEACLAHAVRTSSVEGTYSVKPLASYTTEIGDALALLADHIVMLVGGNVVDLPSKKGAAR
jgi:integrase